MNELIIFIIVFVVVLFLKKLFSAKSIKKSHKKKNFEQYRKSKINDINSHRGNLYETIHKQHTYITEREIGIYFGVTQKEINLLFKKLSWVEENGKWLVATELGLKNGAKQKYNAKTKSKYVLWNSSIKQNDALKDLLSRFKIDSTFGNKKRDILDTNKQKGDQYEAYVANYFKNLGYYVWEHGKEKGVKDGGIDLFVKKGKYSFFVQCKNWESWKIDDKTVKATQTDVRNYMLQNANLTQLLKHSKKKILYVTSKECLTKGAYKYIQENQHILEYHVIPMV